jgi:glycosyltransferase involved in cell wall biosynthesis
VTTSRKRVLMISPLFPPAADSEAFCAGKTAQALRDAGCDVEVISCSNYPGAVRRDNSRLWKEFSSYTHDLPLTSGSWVKSIPSILRFGTVFFSRWVRDVVDLAEQLHAANPFDLVQSRSLPMIAHVAGYHVSKRLSIPWNANINDPWDFHLFPDAMRRNRLHRYIHAVRALLYFQRVEVISNYWMRKTFCNSDLITYCSSRLRNYHLALADIPHRSTVLPHIGWSLPSRPGQGLHLVHAGKLGANEFTGRSTRTLLHGMAAFVQKHQPRPSEFFLTLVGPEDPETANLVRMLGLQEFVHSVGPVSYEESLRWIASATVCVLVEARMEEGIFFPSKCADYIAAGKPILTFSPEKGVIADLAAFGTGFTQIREGDSDRLVAVFEGLSLAQQNGTLEQLAPHEALRQLCSSHEVAQAFLEATGRALLKVEEKTATRFPLWEKTFTSQQTETSSAHK